MATIQSPRLLALLQILVQHDDYVSTQFLAEVLSVSNRTVFREIQNAKDILKPFHLELESKTGFGFKLIGSPKNMQDFAQSIASSNDKMTYFNAQERRELLMIECLMQTSQIKLSHLASMFQVSEGTMSRDLDLIEAKLTQHNLQLVRKQGYGLEILGSEGNVRKALIEAIHQQLSHHNQARTNTNQHTIWHYFKHRKRGIFGLLNHETIRNVIDVLEHSSTQFVSRITEQSYIGLVIHLTIALERILAGDSVWFDANLIKDPKDQALFKDAKNIISDIETRFQVTFPASEVAYVFMHLKGARPRNLAQGQQQKVVSNSECMHMVESLVARFSVLIGEDLNTDEGLIEGLLAHLQPTLSRIEYGLEIRNPLLKEIKAQYPELFDIVETSVEILYLEHNLKLSEDEVAYLTLHFGAALERLKLTQTNQKALNIGVVCASGIGISALLTSKIKATFLALNDVIPLSVDDVKSGRVEHVDMLVTTLDIESDIPSVHVNALLRSGDLMAIQQGLDALTKQQDTIPPHDITEIDWHVIEAIQLQRMDLNQSKADVIQTLIRSCRDDHSLYPTIYAEIKRREAREAVILEDFEFVMYHALVKGLKNPEVIFFKKAGTQGHQDFQNISRGLFMIIPDTASTNTRKTMSAITTSILDCEGLMDAIDSEDRETLIDTIRTFMEDKIYGTKHAHTN